MRTLLIALAAGVLLAGAAPVVAQESESADNIVEHPADDPAMIAAIAEAQRTLPSFWRRFDADAEVRETSLLKVAFPAKEGGKEHMWVRELARRDGKIVGLLDNDPVLDVGFKSGDPVTVDPAAITDWMYERGGRRWGAFTVRVFVEQMDAARAAPYRQILSDKPVEP